MVRLQLPPIFHPRQFHIWNDHMFSNNCSKKHITIRISTQFDWNRTLWYGFCLTSRLDIFTNNDLIYLSKNSNIFWQICIYISLQLLWFRVCNAYTLDWKAVYIFILTIILGSNCIMKTSRQLKYYTLYEYLLLVTFLSLTPWLSFVLFKREKCGMQ